MVSVNKIIDVNFNVTGPAALPGSYPRHVLFSDDATVLQKDYASLVAVEADFNNATAEYSAASLFFANGGVTLNIALLDTTGSSQKPLAALLALEAVLTDFIFFSYVAEPIEADIIELVTALDLRKAPDQRIVCLSVDDVNAKTVATTDIMSVLIAANLNSACAKYSTSEDYVGILIGAYFSQVDLDKPSSIKDYTYTSESGVAAEGLTDAEYDFLIGKNYNFNDTIGGNLLNLGGNLSSGFGLDVTFGTIALENDVAAAVLDTILGKEYMSKAGQRSIQAAVSDSILRYQTNGLILIGSTYTGVTQEVVYNGITFQLIRNNQTLTDGFIIFAIPVLNISSADKAARRLPPIYVYVNSQGGIRKVTVIGEVRA